MKYQMDFEEWFASSGFDQSMRDDLLRAWEAGFENGKLQERWDTAERDNWR